MTDDNLARVAICIDSYCGRRIFQAALLFLVCTRNIYSRGILEKRIFNGREFASAILLRRSGALA